MQKKRKTRREKIEEGGERPLSKYQRRKLRRSGSVHISEILAHPNISLSAKDYV